MTEDARPTEETVEVRETSGNGGAGRRRRVLTWAVGIGVPVLVAAAVIGFVRAGDGDGPGNGGKGTPTTEVTCWDGSSAESRSGCPVPKGRTGLQTVFPSLDESCHQGDVFAEGKVELFECVYDGYTIKYSRWEKGADRYAFFDKNNAAARRAKWYIEGTFAGRTWTGLDERPDQARPFRWLATYRTAPFEVLVQGVDEEARAAGRDRVTARTPEEIGLR